MQGGWATSTLVFSERCHEISGGAPLLTFFEKWAAAPPTPEGWFFHHRWKGGPSPSLAFVKLDFLIGTKWGVQRREEAKAPIPEPEPAAERP